MLLRKIHKKIRIPQQVFMVKKFFVRDVDHPNQTPDMERTRPKIVITDGK